MSMNYFDKKVNSDLLNCVSLKDEQRFIEAYNGMVSSLNIYETRILEKYPEFDISKVFRIDCILDLKLSKRTFRTKFFIREIYPNITEEDAIEIEKSIMLILDEMLFKQLRAS